VAQRLKFMLKSLEIRHCTRGREAFTSIAARLGVDFARRRADATKWAGGGGCSHRDWHWQAEPPRL